MGIRGNDTVEAGGGDDTIIGGFGFDQLWGETGADTFTYKAVAELAFKNGKFDRIMDFSTAEGDRIDLSALDANTRSGHQTFKFAGDGDGWARRGQFDYYVDNGTTFIYGYTDKDKNPEFYIEVDGVVDFKSTDFVL